MNAVIAVVLIATTYAREPKHCSSDLRLFVSERARQVYVDPSDVTRSRVTRELEKTVLPLLMDEKFIDEKKGAECGGQILPVIADFADEVRLMTFLPVLKEKYEAAHERSYQREGHGDATYGISRGQIGVGRAAAALRRRSPRTSAPGDFATREVECSNRNFSSAPFESCDEWIEAEVASGNIAMRPFLRGYRAHVSDAWQIARIDGQIAWLDLLDREKESLQRLRRALDLRSLIVQSTTVRDLALDASFGQIDPRGWEVDELATVIVIGRALDDNVIADRQRKVLADRKSGVIRGNGRAGVEHERHLYEILRRLRPIGYVKAFNLVGMKSLSVSGINTSDGGYILEGGGRGEVRTWEHFPGEYDLYEHEWALKNGHGPKPRMDYVERRWHETDSAAPEVDFERIREFLDTARRSEWTGGRASTHRGAPSCGIHRP